MVLVVAVAGLMFTGCKSKEEKPRNRTLKGKVDRIDVNTKMMSMQWFSEKSDRPIFLAAPCLPETEIYIDGKLSDISQIRPGDPVVVEGYKQGSDLKPLKVIIDRSTGEFRRIKPADTQPAK